MPKRRSSRRKTNAPVENTTFENEIEFDNMDDSPLTKRTRTESRVEHVDLSVIDTVWPSAPKETSLTTSKPETVVLSIRRENAQSDTNKSIYIGAEANMSIPVAAIDKPYVRDVSTTPIITAVRRPSVNFTTTVSRSRTISSPV